MMCMLFLLFHTISAVIFQDNEKKMFLAKHRGHLILSPQPEDALDISIENTDPPSISSILSTGTQAIHFKNRIGFSAMNRKDDDQFFKIVLNHNGGYVFQHKDMCIGYSENFKSENNGITMISCRDIDRVIKFNKFSRRNGKVIKKKTVSYAEVPMGEETESNDPTYNHHFERKVAKPEDTKFLSENYERGSHYY
jgi:hypothetical protein